MRILMNLTGDESKASSRVRGYWISEALEQLGHTVRIVHTSSVADYPGFLAKLLSYDATIIQKKYGRYDLLSAQIGRWLGKPVFFDIDDAPSRVSSEKVIANAKRMMRLSKGVFAGCDNLVNLARETQPNTVLIPSGIRRANYRIKDHAQSDKVTFGWIGNGAHYSDDLIQILKEPLSALSQTHAVRFRLIGACGVAKLYQEFGEIENLELDFIDQLDWANSAEVADALSHVDIGLYPLGPNDFNEYKCAFKALEYMASGIPVVASAVGANAETIRHNETGFLCYETQDWITHLKQLVEDTELRKRFGSAGVDLVDSSFDVRKIAEKIDLAIKANG